MARMFVKGEFMDYDMPNQAPQDMTPHMDRLRSKADVERYERAFAVDPKSFSSYPDGEGPHDEEYWDTAHDDLNSAVVSWGCQECTPSNSSLTASSQSCRKTYGSCS